MNSPYEVREMLSYVFLHQLRPLTKEDFVPVVYKPNSIFFITEDAWHIDDLAESRTSPMFEASFRVKFRWHETLREQLQAISKDNKNGCREVEELIKSICFPPNDYNVVRVCHYFNYRGVKNRPAKIEKEREKFMAKVAAKKEANEALAYEVSLEKTNDKVRYHTENFTDRMRNDITNNLTQMTKPSWEKNPEFMEIQDKIADLKSQIKVYADLIAPIQEQVDTLYKEDRAKKFDVVEGWMQKQKISDDLKQIFITKIKEKRNEVPTITRPRSFANWD